MRGLDKKIGFKCGQCFTTNKGRDNLMEKEGIKPTVLSEDEGIMHYA